MAQKTWPSVADNIDQKDLINGVYEKKAFPDNLRERAVPDYGYNVLSRLQNMYEPVADYDHLKNGGIRPAWPDGAEFAVCLTHDVDHIRSQSPLHTIRNTKTNVRAQWRLREYDEPTVVEAGIPTIIRTLAQGVLDTANDIVSQGSENYHRLDRWTEIEREFGVRSTFFILPPSQGVPHVSDGDYSLSDRVQYNGRTRDLSSVLRDMHDKGWEIGLHPSWYTFDDTELLRSEKQSIEKKLDIEINSVRQHWLHYDPVKTPKVHANAGLKFDSTLGFNNNIGFRRGTAYPWRLQDLQTNGDTEVVEIPLIIQDVALHRRKGLDISSSIAFKYIKDIIERIQEVNGVLTLLWHPNAPEEFLNLYIKLLDYLTTKDVWFGTVQEIGQHWLQENQSILERNIE